MRRPFPLCRATIVIFRQETEVERQTKKRKFHQIFSVEQGMNERRSHNVNSRDGELELSTRASKFNLPGWKSKLPIFYLSYNKIRNQRQVGKCLFLKVFSVWGIFLHFFAGLNSQSQFHWLVRVKRKTARQLWNKHLNQTRRCSRQNTGWVSSWGFLWQNKNITLQVLQGIQIWFWKMFQQYM